MDGSWYCGQGSHAIQQLLQAEEDFSSEQAATISFSEKSISVKLGTSSHSLVNNSFASLTTHSGLGCTNTELYCFPNSAAAKSGSGFGWPEDWSMNGPILALVFCLYLLKEKKDFGFVSSWASDLTAPALTLILGSVGVISIICNVYKSESLLVQ